MNGEKPPHETRNNITASVNGVERTTPGRSLSTREAGFALDRVRGRL